MLTTPTGMLVPNGGLFENRWLAGGGRIVRAAVLFQFGSQTLGNFLLSARVEDLVALTELIEAGKVTPVMDRTYPLSETAQAISHVGEGHARGKVTISVPAPIRRPTSASIAVAS
jgi:NADPH:quinone reductase-like Zn-dependent oxidoreductase